MGYFLVVSLYFKKRKQKTWNITTEMTTNLGCEKEKKVKNSQVRNTDKGSFHHLVSTTGA